MRPSTFKVNDGTDDSVDTYRINIDVRPMNDPVTGKPGITGTAQVGRDADRDGGYHRGCGRGAEPLLFGRHHDRAVDPG